MTTSYHAIISRYKNSDRRQCAPIFFAAENFNMAVAHANALLQGMRLGDAESDYEIAEIRCIGFGGKWCTHEWLTEEDQKIEIT